MKKLTLILSVILATLAAPAMAETLNPEQFRIANVQIREVTPTAAELYSEALVPSSQPNLQSIDFTNLDWDSMVLIGQKIIEIVKAGQPVVNIKRDAVAVVPKGITAWEQLAGWQAPMTKVFEVTMQNGFGMNVIDLRLKVSAMWGGNANGKGAFLSNVLVVPTSTNVLWGFTLDLWTENREPVNAGSVDSPVAGLGFDVRYKVSTWIQEQTGTADYFLRGDGTIQALE